MASDYKRAWGLPLRIKQARLLDKRRGEGRDGGNTPEFDGLSCRVPEVSTLALLVELQLP